MRVGIVGVGQMGSWFARLFSGAGEEVLVNDMDRSKVRKISEELGVKACGLEDLARESDLVIVATPIAETPAVVSSVAGLMRKGSILTDICSVKEKVVSTMKGTKTEAELVSLHPLFGPGASDLRGKDVIVIPVRVRSAYRSLKKRLIEMGARITEMGAEEHDKLMAVVQCLPHLTVMSFLFTLGSMREFLTEDVRTPMFEHLLLAGKALLARDPDLYGEIQVHNKYASIVRERMLEVCRSMDVALSAGDAKIVEKKFSEVENLFSKSEKEKAYMLLYRLFEGEDRK
jgi:prephenate dehydrogenase